MADETNTTETPAPETPETNEPEATVETEPTDTTPEGEASPDETPEGETAEGQPNPEEPKTEETPAESPAVEKAARMVASAARKEKKALEALKTARQFEDKAKALDEIQADFKTDPLSALTKLGLTPEAVYKLISDAPDPNDRVTQLEKKLKDQEAATQRAQTDARFREMQTRVIDEIKTKGDEFEYLNATGNYDLVIDGIVEYHRTHGVGIAPAAVAKAIEDQFDELIAVLSATKKFANRGTKPASRDTKPTAAKGATSAAKPKATTLTNTGAGRSTVKTDPIDLDDPDAWEKHLRSFGVVD